MLCCKGLGFFSPNKYPLVPAPLLKRLLFFYWNNLAALSKVNWSYKVWDHSGLPIRFHSGYTVPSWFRWESEKIPSWFEMVLIILNLLRHLNELAYDLSWGMSHVHLRRMCTLLLSGGVLSAVASLVDGWISVLTYSVL